MRPLLQSASMYGTHQRLEPLIRLRIRSWNTALALGPARIDAGQGDAKVQHQVGVHQANGAGGRYGIVGIDRDLTAGTAAGNAPEGDRGRWRRRSGYEETGASDGSLRSDI
jgi:hypothetical protein